jgi:hypothetical protein
MKPVVLKPWEHITVEMRCHSAWRFRWSLGFWLMKLGAHCISSKVTVSVSGANDAGVDHADQT